MAYALEVDCSQGRSGLIAEVELSPEEMGPLLLARTAAVHRRVVEQMKQAALGRLQDRATSDPVLRDLLFVLGLGVIQ